MTCDEYKLVDWLLSVMLSPNQTAQWASGQRWIGTDWMRQLHFLPFLKHHNWRIYKQFITNKIEDFLWNYFMKCEITKEIKITMKEIMWLGDKRQKIGKYHQILLILSLFLRGLYRAEGLRQQIDWDGLEEMGERPIPLLMIKLHKQMSCRLELYPFQSLERRRYIQNEKLLLLYRNSQTLNPHYFKTIVLKKKQKRFVSKLNFQ